MGKDDTAGRDVCAPKDDYLTARTGARIVDMRSGADQFLALDRLHAMHGRFVGGGLAGSALFGSGRRDRPRLSRGVWRKPWP
jgi:hypothetical protein